MHTYKVPDPVMQRVADRLLVKTYASRAGMGIAAGIDVSLRIKKLMQHQEIVRIIFAAAPSQLELLAFLAADESINWQRIDAFHMDEYIGLPEKAPERFSTFLSQHLFEKVTPRRVHFIDDREGIQAACQAYAQLLGQAPVDIVCLGIGENGHIAFNDPPVADFYDTEKIKPVILDAACRRQQVNDGCFPNIDAVPEKALTLTIPTLLSGKYLYCVVPGIMKSTALKNVLTGEISTDCPASVLRTHHHCMLYADKDACSQLS